MKTFYEWLKLKEFNFKGVADVDDNQLLMPDGSPNPNWKQPPGPLVGNTPEVEADLKKHKDILQEFIEFYRNVKSELGDREFYLTLFLPEGMNLEILQVVARLPGSLGTRLPGNIGNSKNSYATVEVQSYNKKTHENVNKIFKIDQSQEAASWLKQLHGMQDDYSTIMKRKYET